jgi:hypothetical protein
MAQEQNLMRDRRGSILVICFLVMAIMVAIGSAAMVRGFTEQRVVQRHVQVASAFQMAEAGLDQALLALKANSNWSGASYTPMASNVGGYEVAVSTLGPTLRRLTVTGHVPSNNPNASGYQRQQIEATVSIQGPPIFDYALFAAGTFEIDNRARVDSYDSRVGAYQDTCAPSFNTTLGQRPPECQQGDIGSNAIATETVELTNRARIDGRIAIGPGGDTQTAIVTSNQAQFIEPPRTLLEEKTLTAQTFPSGTATGSLSLDNTQQQTLSAGTYRYTSVELNNHALVEVTGNVTLYVEGPFEMSNQSRFVTTSADSSITLYVNGEFDLDNHALLSAAANPTKLKVFVTGDRPVELSNASQLFGTLHAPRSAMSLDNHAKLYGAAIANSVEVSNQACVHYDRALGAVGAAGTGFVQLRSWQEL